jgi:hypothetical protein
MLFFNVAMIFLFIFMFQAIYDSVKLHQSNKIIYAIIAIVTPFLFFDTAPYSRGFMPYSTFALPSPDASELALANLEKGMLLELPIENRRNEKGLDSFMMYRFSIHHKPIINWLATSIPSPHQHAYEYLRQITQISPPELVESARLLGAKYLLVDNSLNLKFASTNVEKIDQGRLRTAYRVINSKDITLEERNVMLSKLNQKPLFLGPFQIH